MKKSRLNLFKSTSMLVSILGVIMIIATIVVVAYIGFNMVSSGITTGISSGNQYDELSQLKANYTALESQFNNSESSIDNNKYDDIKLELTRSSGDIDDVDSALAAGKSSQEVNNRIAIAKKELNYTKKLIDESTNSS
ncbi:hypothetical protein BGI41_07130 [Methanobrevibacter sp. 87.7]|uniref:hypothetical protein n=1 Tax=Methanobrevibacter sp. 87.7 TaxID=387957 RepID=UPI000B51143E|nr:hypothetical protein [Methanobrevibacter sp. 87.7]OWT32545.1 hypothetical protein BGI41_07130 [Methanobrevibacter sp. 87.7]